MYYVPNTKKTIDHQTLFHISEITSRTKLSEDEVIDMLSSFDSKTLLDPNFHLVLVGRIDIYAPLTLIMASPVWEHIDEECRDELLTIAGFYEEDQEVAP